MKKRIVSMLIAALMIIPMFVELSTNVSIYAASSPSMEIKKVDNIEDESARISVKITCKMSDKITKWGLYYGEDQNMSQDVLIEKAANYTYISSTSTTVSLSNLQPETKYFCCVYAISSSNKVYKSDIVSFTTLIEGKIIVTTNDATNIDDQSVTLSLEDQVVGNCSVKARGFYYGESLDSMKWSKCSSGKTSRDITELKPGTTYYYYAFVTSDSGKEFIGETKTFTTAAVDIEKFVLYHATSLGESRSDKKSVYLYDEFKVELSVEPSNARTDNIIWTSSDENILVINGNWVETVGSGKATITASTPDGKFSDYITVTVSDESYYGEAPKIETIEAIDDDNIYLKWTRPSSFHKSDKVGYKIYRSETYNGEYVELTTLTDTEYNDVTVKPATTFYYKIRAYELDSRWRQSTDLSKIVSATTKEYVYVPKNKNDNTNSNNTPAKPDPVVTTSNNTPAKPDPVENTTKSVKPTVTGLKSAYTITVGDKLPLNFTVTAGNNGKLQKITIKHNKANSYSNSVTASSTSKNVSITMSGSPINKVGTYEFIVYASASNFTVTENDIAKFTVNVVEKASTSVKPTVTGLKSTYTITVGDKLPLNFTVTAGNNGKLQKITIKHNKTNSYSKSVTANAASKNVSVNITGSPINKVGTYEFIVYASASNFTVKENDIAKFTVTVVDKVCSHKNKSEAKSIEYTNIILTDSKHTYYETVNKKCKDCGADLGTTNYSEKSAKHTVDKTKGYCECGYMDVSGFKSVTGYNNTGKTQNVYRTPTNKNWYGSINADENVTILGECSGYYLIEYTISGGIKQGYVKENILTKNNASTEKVGDEYSLFIDDKYFYTNILDYNKLLVAEKYNYYKLRIYNNTTNSYETIGSNPNLKIVYNSSSPITIDKYGTLCILNDGYVSTIQLQYRGNIIDRISVIGCTDISRFTTLDAISDSDYWINGDIVPNDLLSVKKKSLEYSKTKKSWILGLDLYNKSFTNMGIASYYPNGTMNEFYLIEGYWENLEFAEEAIKSIISVTDIPQLILGNKDIDDSDLFHHNFKKTSIKISVPDGGYIKVFCSNESNEVLVANMADLFLGILETSEDFKSLLSDAKINKNLRDCINKSKFSNKLLSILNNYNMIGEMCKIIINEEATNAAAQIASLFTGNEKAMQEILQSMTECMDSLPENIAFDIANKTFDMLIKGDKKQVFTQGLIFSGKLVQLAGIIKFTAAEILNDENYTTHGLLIFSPN